MAISNFIPQIWSASILSNLSTRQVGAALCNRNYEGEISGGGDTVNITNFVDPTIKTYVRNTDITVDANTDGTLQLLIDQEKYFAIQVDDVDKAQSKDGGAILSEQTARAAYGLKNTQDVWLLSAMAAAATAVGGADQAVTAATAYDFLVDLAVALDENDIQEEGRWAVVPPAFHGLLLKDERFIKAGDDPSAATRQNGRVGEAAGLQIHKSNNLPASAGTDTGPLVLAGYNGATTLAEQIVSVEADRMEKRFADMVKGLHVYGAKVLRPEGLVKADFVL